MLEIKKIPSEQTYIIRQKVLRIGKPIESCFFEGDNLDSTTHFGMFIANQLAGVVSVFNKKNDLFSDEFQYQIRGMAILSEYQNKGIGKLLVEKVENNIITEQKKECLVWFNARENAVGFYKKLNYFLIDKPFEVVEIGTHYIMHKKLQ